MERKYISHFLFNYTVGSYQHFLNSSLTEKNASFSFMYLSILNIWEGIKTENGFPLYNFKKYFFLPCFLGCMWVLDFVRRTEQKLCKSQAPPKASPDWPNEYHNRLEHGHLLLPVPHLAQLSRSSHQKRHPFLKN